MRMARLLAFMNEDVRYEDVPTGAVFYGHDGIRQMGAGALQMSSDMSCEVVRRVTGQGRMHLNRSAVVQTQAQSVHSRGQAVFPRSTACPSENSPKLDSSSRNGTTGTLLGSQRNSVPRFEKPRSAEPPPCHAAGCGSVPHLVRRASRSPANGNTRLGLSAYEALAQLPLADQFDVGAVGVEQIDRLAGDVRLDALVRDANGGEVLAPRAAAWLGTSARSV